MNFADNLKQDEDRLLTLMRSDLGTVPVRKILQNELDRLLVLYNQDCADPVLQCAAAGLVRSVSRTVPVMEAAKDAKIWEHSGEKKKAFPFWLLIDVWIIAALVFLFFTGGEQAKIAAVAAFMGVAALQVFLLIRRTTANTAEQKAEILIDAESAWQALYAAALTIDHSLSEIGQELEAMKRKTGPEDEVLTKEQTELYAQMLEASYADDGEDALQAVESLKFHLHRIGVELVDSQKEHPDWFETLPASQDFLKDGRGLIRPAMVCTGKLLKKGLAAGGKG